MDINDTKTWPAAFTISGPVCNEFTPAGKKLTLEEAQKAVGGYVTYMPMPGVKGYKMLVDEDGLPRGLPFNVLASFLAKQPVVGNALVVKCGLGW